ncbi:MAG TPA: ABC transporter permease [Chloroflexia bacterium]|nr:ABC transporter permease [Chloroflexia bacterium]
MSFPRMFAIAGRIIAQFKRDHRTLGLLFIAPILVMSILGYVLRSQEDTTINVAVTNQDSPPAGQTSAALPVIESLRQNDRLQITELSRDETEKAVRSGTQRVGLVFGPNFTKTLHSDRNTSLEVIVEGSNPGQAGSALGIVGQSIMQSAPVVLKELMPPALAGAFPSSLPIKLETTRLYGREDLGMVDFFAPMFIAYIGFFLIFLLTSVSFLRERTQGTMERLSASPVTRTELVLGYMLGFGFFALLQATILLLFTIYVLQIKYNGSLAAIFVVTLLLVLGAVNLGIFLSTFARNELQAIQFIPIVILPQVLLSGLLWPVQDMPGWLQAIARLMPLTYAIDALTDIMIRGKSLWSNPVALGALLGFAVLAALLGAMTMKREVA